LRRSPLARPLQLDAHGPPYAAEQFMRIMNHDYRNDRKFVWRRLDRAAGHVNVFLAVIAIGLGALDLFYAAHKIAAGWPHVTVVAGKSDTSPKSK